MDINLHAPITLRWTGVYIIVWPCDYTHGLNCCGVHLTQHNLQVHQEKAEACIHAIIDHMRNVSEPGRESTDAAQITLSLQICMIELMRKGAN